MRKTTTYPAQVKASILAKALAPNSPRASNDLNLRSKIQGNDTIATSLRPANKSRDVELQKMNCQQTIVPHQQKILA